MKKIPTLFSRDPVSRRVTSEVAPGCEWVLAGDGLSSKKIDGTNVKVEAGVLYKRQKPPGGDYDEASYVPASRDEPSDRYIFEAFDNLADKADGIYEAIGPKIQGNPEKRERHELIRVVPADERLLLAYVPLTFDGLRSYLAVTDIEGVVFHHPDGRMAKIKKRDFGLKR